VRIRALGAPIVCSTCYCDDCLAGARQLEALGANGEFHDASGGTPYMVFRDDWIACVEGCERLQGVKLRDDVPTYRSFPLALLAPLLKARTGMLFKTRLR